VDSHSQHPAFVGHVAWPLTISTARFVATVVEVEASDGARTGSQVAAVTKSSDARLWWERSPIHRHCRVPMRSNKIQSYGRKLVVIIIAKGCTVHAACSRRNAVGAWRKRCMHSCVLSFGPFIWLRHDKENRTINQTRPPFWCLPSCACPARVATLPNVILEVLRSKPSLEPSRDVQYRGR
jgi:hypothetical protein